MSQEQSLHTLQKVVNDAVAVGNEQRAVNVSLNDHHAISVKDTVASFPTVATAVIADKRFKSGGKYGAVSIPVPASASVPVTPPNTPTTPIPHSFPTLSKMNSVLQSRVLPRLPSGTMLSSGNVPLPYNSKLEPDSASSTVSQQSDPNDFIAIDNGWDDFIESYCTKDYELCHGYAWMNDQMSNDCTWYANAMFFGNLLITSGLTLLSSVGVFYPNKGKEISIVTGVITVLLGIFITVQRQYKFPERASEYTTQSKKFAETKTAIYRQLILPRYRRYEGAMYSDSLRDTYNVLIDTQTVISNSVRERYRRKLIDDNLIDTVAIPVDSFEPITINRVDIELKSRVRKGKTNVDDIIEFIDQQNANTNSAMGGGNDEHCE